MATIRIPGYDRQIIQQPAQQETPVLKPGVPEEAFGTGVADAGLKYGESVSRLGTTIQKGSEQLNEGFNKVAEQQYKEEEQAVLSADTQFRMNMKDSLTNPEVGDNGVPKGLLQRNLEHANGITKEFDNSYPAMRQQALQTMPTAHQREALARRMDEHYTQMRGVVQGHEGEQKQEAYKTALEANTRQRISDAALIQDPQKLQDALDEVMYFRSNGLQRAGVDPASASIMAKQAGSDLVNANIAARLETDPGGAKVMFDAVKKNLDPSNAAKIQATIDGKFADVKENQLWSDLQDDAKFKLSDGTYDKQKLMDYAAQNASNPEEQKSLMKGFLGRAGAADAALKDSHDAQMRSFQNNAIQLFNKSVPRDKAKQYLFGGKQYGWDISSRSDMEDQLDKLYSGNHGPFVEDAMKNWSDDQKLAMSDIKHSIELNYKDRQETLPGDSMPTKLAPHVIDTLQKRFVMGNMSATQMRQEAENMMKGQTVTKSGVLWNTKTDNWKVGEAHDRLLQQQIDGLRKNPRYSSEVDDAIGALRRNGIANPTANTIQIWIDSHR